MKILISAACACVIGMTALFLVSQYIEARNAQRAEFWAYCQQLDSPEQTAKIEDWKEKNYQSELRMELKKIKKCQDVVMNGW
jgi:hypothetical protein